MNFRIRRQKIKLLQKKTLGIILDENLIFKNHLDHLKFKLNRENCILEKIRYSVKPLLLRTIYFEIFDSQLRYGCQIWSQTEICAVKNIKTLHNKALCIINFKGPRTKATNLYKDSEIM